jgi:hypothetical protein
MSAIEDPELVLLFADVDAQAMVETLITRGIERACLRQFRWTSVREPMRDAKVAQDPSRALQPFLNLRTARFAVLWDQHGSGLEGTDSAAEDMVVKHLRRVDVDAKRVVAVAFAPELESALIPVWDRIVEIIAAKRSKLPFSAGEPNPLDPKASFKAVLAQHSVKSNPLLFRELANQLSIPSLKNGRAIGKLAAALVDWFGVRSAEEVEG